MTDEYRRIEVDIAVKVAQGVKNMAEIREQSEKTKEEFASLQAQSGETFAFVRSEITRTSLKPLMDDL